MTDTGFTVPQEKVDRLTTAYAVDPETGEVSVLDDPTDSWWRTPTSFPDASGWLVSTIDDYWSFVSMVLAGGSWHSRQVLSPESVALLTTDRLSATQREASKLFLGEQEGWGMGLAVPATGSTAPPPSGIGWDGHRNHVAFQPPQRSDRNPLHPTCRGVAGTDARGQRLLERPQCRRRELTKPTMELGER
jgi:CubicO group peptidase (beta-lactamase class C family)